MLFAGGKTATGPSDAVDIFNVRANIQFNTTTIYYYYTCVQNNAAVPVSPHASYFIQARTGLWTRAKLSAARFDLAAASLPLQVRGHPHKVAQNLQPNFGSEFCTLPFVIAPVNDHSRPVPTPQHLVVFAGGSGSFVTSATVDIYDALLKTFTVAALSAPRSSLAATSLYNLGLAFFAGGYRGLNTCSDVVDVFNATSRSFLPTGATPVTAATTFASPRF